MVKWDQIDTVLLDMDGVLLDLRFDNWFWNEHVPAQFAAKRGVCLDHARSQVFPKLRAARQFGIFRVLAVHQPDSGQPKKDSAEFDAISSFAEIMPS